MHEAEKFIKSNVKSEIAAGGSKCGSVVQSRKVDIGPAQLPTDRAERRAASYLQSMREVLYL